MDTIFIFSICFSFWPVGLNIDQEAVNIFIFLKKSVHKCSVKKKKKRRGQLGRRIVILLVPLCK